MTTRHQKTPSRGLTTEVNKHRLELLLFGLKGQQQYGVNVFKIREIMTLPPVTIMPRQHPSVIGVVHLRGRAVPVFDLAVAMGRSPLPRDEHTKLLVTEYNSSVQAFVVSRVEKIVNMDWSDVKPPPAGSGKSHFLTAITEHDGKLVEVIDVERILAQVQPPETDVPDGVLDQTIMEQAAGLDVLMVDDSTTAITQTKRTLEPFGLVIHTATDGAKGLAQLQAWAAQPDDFSGRLLCVITDAEMPVMDGYTLTQKIREDPALKDLYVILHSSLSGQFNQRLAEKAGCDTSLSKFNPEALALLIQDRLREMLTS